jgi:hypothetical protein
MSPLNWDALYEQTRVKQFELGATLPVAWQSTASTLKHAADRLFDIYHDATLREISRAGQLFQSSSVQPQAASEPRQLAGDELEGHWDMMLISVYFFLMGCSMENLLKGILMLRHPEYLKASGELTGIKSHDLVKLCGKCNIDLSRKEKELFAKLTTYITWAGRYPVPLTAHDMFPKKKADGTWVQRGESFRGRDPQSELNRIWIRLWGELERFGHGKGLSN